MRKASIQYCLPALLLMLLCHLASAQQKISGTVKNEQGALMPFASVVLNGVAQAQAAVFQAVNTNVNVSYAVATGRPYYDIRYSTAGDAYKVFDQGNAVRPVSAEGERTGPTEPKGNICRCMDQVLHA